MNLQLRAKHFRGDSNANASCRPRTVIPTKRPASRQQSAEPNRCSAAPDPRFYPACGLMIGLGWLRLFRAIVSDGIPSGRSPFPHARKTLLWQSVVITKRPKLMTEMSCRSGTWVHLRCTLNAASAPFLESCGPSQPQQGLPRTEAPVVSTDSPASKSAQGCYRVGLP